MFKRRKQPSGEGFAYLVSVHVLCVQCPMSFHLTFAQYFSQTASRHLLMHENICSGASRGKLIVYRALSKRLQFICPPHTSVSVFVCFPSLAAALETDIATCKSTSHGWMYLRRISQRGFVILLEKLQFSKCLNFQGPQILVQTYTVGKQIGRIDWLALEKLSEGCCKQNLD